MAKRQPLIGHEVAEASRAMSGTQQRGHPGALIASARQLERYLTKRRALRRQLKLVDANIRHEKKMLRALAGAEGGEL